MNEYDYAAKLGKKRPISDQSATSTVVADPPALYDAEGNRVEEMDGNAAAPWGMRAELEGSRPAPGLSGVGGSSQPGQSQDSAAELVGSERYAGEQGQRSTLGGEAKRQLGPGWNGDSLKALNGNGAITGVGTGAGSGTVKPGVGTGIAKPGIAKNF
jgi:hypothetical protein